MKPPRVPIPPGESDVPEFWHPSKVLKSLAQVNDGLCNPSYEDGTPKGERSMMVFARSGSCTIVFKIERPALKLVVSGPTFDEALAALEASLSLPNCPWQVDDNPLGRRNGKRK